jgi:arsenate reductase
MHHQFINHTILTKRSVMTIRIFHNPRCSKSRATLALLQEKGHEPEIRLYLENPPSADELKSILDLLGRRPRELMRKGEAEYREQNLANPELANDQLVAAMVASPKLIERPIVLANGKAAIGRPPESVLEIL